MSPTEYGIRTLMHDPMYRTGVANKNTGYDQIGFASFYLGHEAERPSMRTESLSRRWLPNTQSKVTDHERDRERDRDRMVVCFGATQYILYRDGVKIGEFTGTSYLDKGLEQGTTYSYRGPRATT